MKLRVKIIETNRLILRRFTEADSAFILELLNEPSWKRYIGDRGIDSLEAARHYLQTVPLASYERHGFGLYAIERKLDSTLVGMCGLIKRDGLDDIDIGFAVLARFEGQGLAKEAAAATLEYSREALGLRRVVAITSIDNERSGRLLERLGMSFERMVRLSEDAEQLRLYGINFDTTEQRATELANRGEV
jgi:RimJ/RimL family protein N-acetyltransferase